MSARLNMNEIPLFSWKGITLTQVTNRIVKNNSTLSSILSKHDLYRALPLKIYRKDIVTGDATQCVQRSSVKIDDINMPNGTIINSSVQDTKDLVNTLDINLINNQTELLGKCKDNNECVANNARRRVRSSGMIKRQFDLSKNNDTYCTSTKQYLVSRNRDFEHNQYNNIRVGTANVKPGEAQSATNVYSSNGLSHCQAYYIGTSLTFQYQWINGIYYNVVIPVGYYRVEDLNSVLQLVMAANRHYLVKNVNQARVFLLQIGYNNFYDTVELSTMAMSTSIFNDPQSNYVMPKDEYGTTVTAWSVPNNTVVPGFKILANDLQKIIGFDAGNYPDIPIPMNIGDPVQDPLTDQVFESSNQPILKPLYVPIYYKPNNPQFAQQGGVTSSSLILRKKYNSINCNSNDKTGCSLAYGVPEYGYTKKDKIGYPNIKTPLFPKYGGQKTCDVYTSKR